MLFFKCPQLVEFDRSVDEIFQAYLGESGVVFLFNLDWAERESAYTAAILSVIQKHEVNQLCWIF